MTRKLIRLYLEGITETSQPVELQKDQAHYLGTVLRLKAGDCLKVFSAELGEWRTRIDNLDRKKGVVIFEERLSLPHKDPFLGLAFCPIRSNRLAFLIEKATELGVTHFFPILTSRTQQKLPAPERLKALAIEAAEQCERLAVPVFDIPHKLSDFIKNVLEKEYPETTPILCDERRKATPLTTEDAKKLSAPLVIIGPEGGFSEKEFTFLETHKKVSFKQLGPNVLRAETAALAALSHFHSGYSFKKG